MELTLAQFLTLLAGGSLSASILSVIAERLPLFQKLDAFWKKTVQLVGTLLLSVGAYAIIQYVPPETLTALAPWFAVIVAAIVAWKANQKTHELDPIR